MGKKKKKKLKKKFIKQRLQALEQQGFKESPKEKPTPAADFVKKEKKEVRTESRPEVDEPMAQKEEITEEKDYIKKDLKKVGFITLALLVIFVVLIIVNLKTNFLSQTANKIFFALNIG